MSWDQQAISYSDIEWCPGIDQERDLDSSWNIVSLIMEIMEHIEIWEKGSAYLQGLRSPASPGKLLRCLTSLTLKTFFFISSGLPCVSACACCILFYLHVPPPVNCHQVVGNSSKTSSAPSLSQAEPVHIPQVLLVCPRLQPPAFLVGLFFPHARNQKQKERFLCITHISLHSYPYYSYIRQRIAWKPCVILDFVYFLFIFLP